ncbi:ATP-binding protein [Pedobacter sp. MR2016-24]|uniref:PAS domain-containing sensor histidine kinase n=1 Tax=Pedobacter sp. MR2016-24 TaxID=2994466 RepID=UPI00224833A5|nr:ATP-binding protein [Pedobacter sp. MR2016-24]MCX2483336.1 ATP-binding protein [Pedobacter sp. MR2016-24]
MKSYNPPSSATLKALETAPGAFLVLSPDLYILTASNLYLEATKTEREALRGRHIFDAFPDNPDLPEADGMKNINASLQEVLRTKKRHVMNFQRYDVPDIAHPGKFITRYWDPSHTPVLDDNGEISYIVQLATNVTDQVLMGRQLAQSRNAQVESALEVSSLTSKLDLAEKELLSLNISLEKQVGQRTVELKNSEENLQAAFDAADLGSCSLNLKTGQAKLSQRYRSLYGLPLSGEITWEMVTAAVEPEFLEEVNMAMINAAEKGTPVDSTYAIRHLETGERRWMRVAGKVRPDGEGSFSHIYAVVMDVTVQKEDEQRKNDFIAMVSHELKTPLTSITGYTQVLAKLFKNNDGLAPRLLEKMERQVKKMSVMIDGFLNISRLEAGKIHLDVQRFDMAALLAEVAEEFDATISSHKILFPEVQQVLVEADRNKIGHVINNLLSNAIKYSPSGAVIAVKCENNESEIIFSVRDEGIGVNPQDLPKLFDRYYRVAGMQINMASGFGIGLYLSAEIISRHGGRIWAESEPGEGSTFYFSLPKMISQDFCQQQNIL